MPATSDLFLYLLPLFTLVYTPRDTIVEGEAEFTWLETQVTNLRDNLQTMRDGMKRARTSEDITQRFNLNYRIDRLNAVIDNLKRLHNGPQRYAVRKDSFNGQSFTTYDSSIDAIVFHIGAMNIAFFVHETTHGQQFENGQMIFHRYKGGFGIGDDLEDELEAYKNQAAVQFATQLRYNINDSITATWLFKQTNTLGHYVYNVKPLYPGDKNSLIGLIPIDINSTVDDLKRAFPMLDTVWQSAHPLQDTNLFYFKKIPR